MVVGPIAAIAGASAGSTAVMVDWSIIVLIMAGAAIGGMIGMCGLLIGATIGG
jgi:hypothetical protein